jgi:hypothetical protein
MLLLLIDSINNIYYIIDTPNTYRDIAILLISETNNYMDNQTLHEL